MTNYTLSIVSSSGKRTIHPLTGRATLGSDGDINIPNASHLAEEHLLIVPQGEEGCWIAHGEGLPVMTTLDGELFEQGVFPWGSTLELGSFELRFEKAAVAGRFSATSTRAMLGGVAGLVLLLVASAVLFGRSDEVSATAAENPPALFGHSPSCPDRVDPRAFAVRNLREGQARKERYPYDEQEGVAAVLAFEVAASCFGAAQLQEQKESAARMGQSMRGIVLADFAVERVRFRRAIQQNQWQFALQSAGRLLRYVDHLGQGSYTKKIQEAKRELQILASASSVSNGS